MIDGRYDYRQESFSPTSLSQIIQIFFETEIIFYRPSDFSAEIVWDENLFQYQNSRSKNILTERVHNSENLFMKFERSSSKYL